MRVKHAICIGISKFPPNLSPLPSAVRDAVDVSELMTKFGFQVTVMIDDLWHWIPASQSDGNNQDYFPITRAYPTKENILRTIEEIMQTAAKQHQQLFQAQAPIIVFFIATHGFQGHDGRQFFLPALPYQDQQVWHTIIRSKVILN